MSRQIRASPKGTEPLRRLQSQLLKPKFFRTVNEALEYSGYVGFHDESHGLLKLAWVPAAHGVPVLFRTPGPLLRAAGRMTDATLVVS